MNGHLARFRLKYLTADTKDITHIIFLEICIRLLTDTVPCDIALDTSLQILYIAERSLSHHALEHHAPCDGHCLPLERVEVILHILAVVRDIKLCNPERVFSCLLQGGKLLPAHSQKLIFIRYTSFLCAAYSQKLIFIRYTSFLCAAYSQKLIYVLLIIIILIVILLCHKNSPLVTFSIPACRYPVSYTQSRLPALPQ